ncbi:MAG: fibronectin type III domain-containing protein [Candidatus Gracilibacteria bacterium]
MNNLFPYTTPDPGRQKALKQMLLKEHRKLYGQEKVSLFAKYKLLFVSPLYALLFLTLGLGSIFSVQAFSSPVAQLYGDIYGFSAQFQIGVQQTLAHLNLAPTPILPGLSKEETTLYAETRSLEEKALLSSKIGRALPISLQDKVQIPSSSTQEISYKNNTTVSLAILNSSSVKLSWQEQRLPSGALPSKYIIERSIGTTSAWQKIAEQTETTFIDQNISGTEKIYYQIKVIDWQDNAAKEVLSAVRPAQAASTSDTVAPPSVNPVVPTTPPVVPILNTNKNSSVPAPVYDFADETQPLVDLQLKVIPEMKAVNQFKLTWRTSTIPNTRGYNIYRDNIKRNVSVLRNTSFTDTDVKSGKSYQYQVRVIGEDGTEIGKSVKVQTTFPFVPNAPSNLEGSYANDTISLQWKAVSATDMKGYIIYRKDLSSGNEIILRTQATSFIDKTINPAASYQYSIAAELTSGIQSARSISLQISSP